MSTVSASSSVSAGSSVSAAPTARELFASRPGSRALLDVGIAAVALLGSLIQLLHGGATSLAPAVSGLDPVAAGLLLCATVPLVVWRRSPLGVYAVTAAASVLLAGLGYPIDLPLGPAAALYLLTASRDQRAPWTTGTTVTVVGLLLAYLVASGWAQGGVPGVAQLHTGVAMAAAWFAGDRTRLRREQLAELRERALRAERDAERERLLAVAEERARIARDLHDSAGHAVSVIAVRAGAARLRQDPQRALPALAAIEELARHTAGEIDQIVATLRDGSAGTAPVGLASLDTLIARHAGTGLTVTVDRTGTPRPLAGPADQAAYRILQEALGNAARHGTGCATLTLDYGETGLDLTVTNPLPATPEWPPSAAPRDGGGHGVIGMRERATLLGGSLDASRADGSFRLYARIPYGGHRP